MELEKINYESPQLTVTSIETEGILASSGDYLDYQKTPSMPYGDDEEQWF